MSERGGGPPGFDVVIGNPPYRRELDYKYLMDEIAGTDDVFHNSSAVGRHQSFRSDYSVPAHRRPHAREASDQR